MNNKGKNKQNKLFRGSISAVKDAKLYEPVKVKQIRIESNGIEAIILPQCFSKDLQTILESNNIKWKTGEIETTRLIKQIEGIPVDNIVNDGRDRVGIEFSVTESEFALKKERIVAWLDANDIPHVDKGFGCEINGE